MKYAVPSRSVLIAPGSDERKIRKALASGADEVVLDLEDSVIGAHKTRARDLVCALIDEIGRVGSVSVRVNGVGTPWMTADLAACAETSGITSVVLPKAETVADIGVVDAALAGTSVGVQALIETPTGVENLPSISAATDRVHAIVLGYADLGAALGRAHTAAPQLWLAVQDRALMSARAAGIAAIDGPYFDISNPPGLSEACRWTRDLGYDGKWAIHPSQVETINSTFTPSEAEVRDAHRVLSRLSEASARGQGAEQLDGTMLDEAVAIAARRTLARVGISMP